MIERILHCDAKDCDTHGSDAYPHWLTVSGDGEPLHFCAWDCLMKYAAQFDPPTVIPLRTVK
jgi:hypothetical protein